MGTGFWAWVVAMVICTFLFWLNSHLRGHLSELGAGVFAVLMLGLVGLSFWFWGWRFGLGAVVGTFVLAAILQRPAARLAHRILRHSEGSDMTSNWE